MNNKEKKTIIVGKLLEFDNVSPAGHYYPKNVLEKAVKNFSKKLENETVYGKLLDIDHPRIENDIVDISHKVCSVKSKDNEIFAEVELLNTTNGYTVQNLIDNNKNVRLVATGLGDLNGYNEVIKFDMTSVDIVPFNNADNKEYIAKVKKDKKLF